MLILGGLLLFNPAVHSAQVSRPLIAVVALAAGLVTFFMLRALLSARDQPPQTGIETLAGATGVAQTAIDPKGTARVQHQPWSAESTGGPIPAGSPIRVVGVRGVILLVEQDTQMAPATGGANEEGMVR